MNVMDVLQRCIKENSDDDPRGVNNFLSSIIGNHSIKQVKYPSMAMITTDTLKLNDEHKNLHESILDILECHKGDDYRNNNNNNNNNKNCDSSTKPHSLEVTQSMINRCYSPPPK